MTPERHIWACANTLISQHVEDAWFHASIRADQLLESGDLDGHMMFKAILARIEQLQQKLPSGSSQYAYSAANTIKVSDSTLPELHGIIISEGASNMRYLAWITALAFAGISTGLEAHSGGLAADGCHNDRKNGGRHCHRRDGGAPPAPHRAFGGALYFPNCASARAAGAAPVRSGQPGYGRHLDRDGDGIGCE